MQMKTQVKKKLTKKKNDFDNIVNPIINNATRRRELIDFANEMKNQIKKDPKIEKLLPEDHKKIIEKKIDELLNFIDKNPNATAEEVFKRKEDLRETIEPMLERARAQEKLSDFCDEIQLRMEDNDGDLHNDLTDDSKMEVNDEIKDVKNFIKNNPEASKKELESKLNSLEKLIKNELDKSKEEIEIKKKNKEIEDKKKKEAKDELNKIRDEKLKKDEEGKKLEKEISDNIEKDHKKKCWKFGKRYDGLVR